MKSPRLARAALLVLFISALAIGLTAFGLPRTFYDDFPFLAHWVNLLPPYNEHLITDVGGLYLGFGCSSAGQRGRWTGFFRRR